jgi:hypothetical protein
VVVVVVEGSADSVGLGCRIVSADKLQPSPDTSYEAADHSEDQDSDNPSHETTPEKPE